jgi:copper chaperone NosL
MGMMTAVIVFSLTGCQKVELKPVDITENDICFRCKSPIADKHYAAELVTKDGFVRKFDDMGCMLQHAKTKIGKDNIVAYYVMDFPSQQWVKAEEAGYVKSDQFKTPKDGGILAFKDRGKAAAFAAQYKMQTSAFDDLIK